jgi:hypothetical protein
MDGYRLKGDHSDGIISQIGGSRMKKIKEENQVESEMSN